MCPRLRLPTPIRTSSRSASVACVFGPDPHAGVITELHPPLLARAGKEHVKPHTRANIADPPTQPCNHQRDHNGRRPPAAVRRQQVGLTTASKRVMRPLPRAGPTIASIRLFEDRRISKRTPRNVFV